MFTSLRCFALFVATLPLLSCEDPYGAERKATATFTFRLAENTNVDPRFTFNEGYLSMQRFTLKMQDNVYKSRQFKHSVDSETTPFILHSATGHETISNTVVPGIFQSMQLELVLTEQRTSLPFTLNSDGSAAWKQILPDAHPILLKGNFRHGAFSRSIILAIDSVRYLNFEAQMDRLGASAEKTIILDKHNFVTLTLAPQRWFSSITTDMMLSAQSVRRNNENIIFIHRTFNPALYRLVVDNLTAPGQLRIRISAGS